MSKLTTKLHKSETELEISENSRLQDAFGSLLDQIIVQPIEFKLQNVQKMNKIYYVTVSFC